MSVDGESSFVTDLSVEAGLKSFCSLISVCYQYYHFWGCAVNQIAEVICIANSFGGLYLSCDISKLSSGFCQTGATKKTCVCVCVRPRVQLYTSVWMHRRSDVCTEKVQYQSPGLLGCVYSAKWKRDRKQSHAWSWMPMTSSAD